MGTRNQIADRQAGPFGGAMETIPIYQKFYHQAGDLRTPVRGLAFPDVEPSTPIHIQGVMANFSGRWAAGNLNSMRKAAPRIALREAGSQKLENLANSVVKGGPNLANQLALTVRPGAVGQERNGNSRFQVEPE